MVREYENAKQSLVEKILKLADCNAQAYKCCHNIRSTKTRIETKKKKKIKKKNKQSQYKIKQKKN